RGGGGGNKGGGGGGEEGGGEIMGTPAARGRCPRRQGISLKAQEKKRLRPRGVCAPEPPVMKNTDATVTAKICGGVSSSGPRISGACYSGVTPSGRLWTRRPSCRISTLGLLTTFCGEWTAFCRRAHKYDAAR